ncbi:MAG: hypothetical protein SPI06_03435 [Terrisporobacter sp.]|uniref:DUF7487 domain-containing protein n=1 Tax=Terrisporobacter sp. TaxID=1965305 RepID=UPI002A9174E3|nr:hypothetical protein [Terrisporobacter sp.]MDY6152441.1 hypothetical protein [Terrisporobacter sp.]
MITDEVIKNKYVDTLERIQGQKLKHITDEELEYLQNRYSDSESIKETIFRIFYNIEVKPKCKYCNNYCRSKIKYKEYYETCSNKECIKKNAWEHHLATFKKNHNGLENPYQLPEVIEKIQSKLSIKRKEIYKKIKSTCLEKYGVDNVAKTIEAKEKSKKTCLEKYGVEYSWQSENNKEKSKKTCLEKYGVEHSSKSDKVKEKVKETCLEKYGVPCSLQNKNVKEKIFISKEIKYNDPYFINSEKMKQTKFIKYGSTGYCNPIKGKQTKIERYGTASYNNREKAKENSLIKYGVEYPQLTKFIKDKIKKSQNTEEVKLKIYNSKKKNNSFGPQSKSESICYLYLSLYYPDVVRQYRDNERYPYNCDFYIPSLDLFIEFQGYYTHGKHPFNISSKEDLQLIKQYKEKYGENCQAITIWTIKDPEKRKCAKEHNLNWIEFFTIDELKDWLENG